VKFVYNRARWRRAVSWLADDRLKPTAIRQDVDIRGVDLDAKPCREIAPGKGHHLGWAKNLPRLLLRRGAAVDLGAMLFVGSEHVETDSSGPSAFAILPGNNDVGLTETAFSVVLPHKSEDIDLDEALPAL